MTTPTRLRTTCTGSAVRPAAPTRARPTPSSPRVTCARPGTWSESWREARQAINPKLLQLVNSGHGGGGGGRKRYHGGGSSANNLNMMFQDVCERRMRSVSRGNKPDSRGSSFSRDGRSGGGRDGDTRSSSSSSYRDRSRVSQGSYASGGADQYQSYGGGTQYSSRAGGAANGAPRGSSGGGQNQSSQPQGVFGPAPPPPAGPKPLMA